MTSHYKTGTHPFYIGMYIHIYTHIYVHIYTSQKECLHIFFMGGRLTLTPEGYIPFPPWGSWENHRLKYAKHQGDMLYDSLEGRF